MVNDQVFACAGSIKRLWRNQSQDKDSVPSGVFSCHLEGYVGVMEMRRVYVTNEMLCKRTSLDKATKVIKRILEATHEG